MSGIHNAIMTKVQAELQKAMIDDIADLVDLTDPLHPVYSVDPTKAGVIQLGPLQGDPDPDIARISITIHENDPDSMVSSGVRPEFTSLWGDMVDEVEIGGGMTWRRRFCIKARCLFVNTQEDLTTARDITSTIRDRIIDTLMSIKFTNTHTDNEIVVRGVFSDAVGSELIQSGGPPDSFDFYVKIRFEVLTQQIIGV